jgi:hypothetical protein
MKCGARVRAHPTPGPGRSRDTSPACVRSPVCGCCRYNLLGFASVHGTGPPFFSIISPVVPRVQDTHMWGRSFYHPHVDTRIPIWRVSSLAGGHRKAWRAPEVHWREGTGRVGVLSRTGARNAIGSGGARGPIYAVHDDPVCPGQTEEYREAVADITIASGNQ